LEFLYINITFKFAFASFLHIKKVIYKVKNLINQLNFIYNKFFHQNIIFINNNNYIIINLNNIKINLLNKNIKIIFIKIDSLIYPIITFRHLFDFNSQTSTISFFLHSYINMLFIQIYYIKALRNYLIYIKTFNPLLNI